VSRDAPLRLSYTEGTDMKLFIADDSVQIRKRLIEMLSELPEVEVTGEAGDAPEAIREIRRLDPDMVILDIRMPGGNGIDVLREIKEKSHPAIIMLTNYPYPQYRKKCMDLGADYFFDKATDFEKVVEVCEQLIKVRELKGTILKLGAQFQSAGITPIADDPLKEEKLKNIMRGDLKHESTGE
jgi:DNA-binding NarL/FixJ family response regulator